MNLKRVKSVYEYSSWLGKIVFALVAPIFVGFFLGNYLDKLMGSEPWITLALIMLGVFGGFWWLYRLSSSTKNDK